MASDRVTYAPGGRNVLVICRCPKCLQENPNGCRIESWKHEAHQKAARSAGVGPPVRKRFRSSSAIPVTDTVDASISSTAPIAGASRSEILSRSSGVSAGDVNMYMDTTDYRSVRSLVEAHDACTNFP